MFDIPWLPVPSDIIPCPGPGSRERPNRSSSTLVLPADAVVDAPASNKEPSEGALWSSCGGSGSKSINDNSLAAFLPTPVLVPRVPAAILLASSTLPAFMRRYLSMVRCMLSLISRSLDTASASSDSSSHIFWILGWALAKADTSSWSSE
jgi:hypothetical protein